MRYAPTRRGLRDPVHIVAVLVVLVAGCAVTVIGAVHGHYGIVATGALIAIGSICTLLSGIPSFLNPGRHDD